MASKSKEKLKDMASIDDSLFRTDISVKESQEIYKQWAHANTYDALLTKPQAYTCLHYLRECLEGLFKNPEDTLVLDIGAGTGLTGKVLVDAGFKNIDGLEPQSEFGAGALNTGIYQKMITEFITGEKTKGIDDDTYDLAACTGAFAPGHIPPEALKEMARIIKPGGYLIISMREEWLWRVPEYKARFQPIVDQLVAQGKWTLVKRQTFPNFFVGKDGVLFLFQIS